jgi:hypothetical protein
MPYFHACRRSRPMHFAARNPDNHSVQGCFDDPRGAVVSDLELWVSSRSFPEPLRSYVPKPGRSTRRATWS